MSLQSLQMDFEYKTLTTDQILDILTKSTMRYNQILLQGGSSNEFELLREAIILLQREIEKRKEEDWGYKLQVAGCRDQT